MKEMICIICPVGCHLQIDENLKVTGNNCIRGAKYALAEMTNPRRTLTTTLKTNQPNQPRISVKSASPLPKDKIFAVMALLRTITVQHPLKIGDVIVENVLETGVNIVATSDFKG